MNYIRIFRSMAILQKEKLVVIKKEFLHLRHIADFYRKESTENYPDPTQREIIAQKIYEDIDHYINKIKDLNRDIDDYYKRFGKGENTYLNFLTLYDYYNEDIKEILKIVKLIQSKFLQFQHEHFNQYMPVPNINKRYSTKGFLDYLKIYHTKALENEGLGAESHPITLWGHHDSFISHDGEDIVKGGEKYIEIPFWHYEIPFMLPFITHEMGHIILDKAKVDLSINSNLEKFKQFLLKNDAIAYAIKGNESFLDEILSDIFALLYHEEAFIIAQAHELLGKNFAKPFYSQNKTNPVNITHIDLKDLKFTEALTRLLITIEIYKIFKLEEGDVNLHIDETVNEIEKILHWIIVPIKEESSHSSESHKQALINTVNDRTSGLGVIYLKHYNLTKTYVDFHFTISKIPNLIIEFINNHYYATMMSLDAISPNDEGILKKYKDTYMTMIDSRLSMQFDAQHDKEILSKDAKVTESIKYIMQTFPETREELNKYNNSKIKNIESRLNNHFVDLAECKISSKNELRKLLLCKDGVFGDDASHDKLSGNLGKPYELTYFKTRTDGFTGTANYMEQLKQEAIKHHETVFFMRDKDDNSLMSPYFTFDYFTAASLAKKKETLGISELNYFLNSSPKNTQKTVKFYSIKHSLILVKEASKNNNEDGVYSVFISFSLAVNNSENTKIAVNYLENIMKNIAQIKAYKIFKSLGPKEIILHIENISLKMIFGIKEKVFREKGASQKNEKDASQENPFHRSYTVIAIKPESIVSANVSGEKLQYGSYVRAKINTKIPSSEHMDTKFLRTGVQDYMIKWKQGTPLSDITSYYDMLINKEKSTDIQTFVSKEEDLTGGESS